MANLAPLLSSVKHTWCTPQRIIDKLLQYNGSISLDPCANKDSIVHAKHELGLDWSRRWVDDEHYEAGPAIDGLKASWNVESGLVYVNPPYGRALPDWMRKCFEEGVNSNISIIALVPARTDTRWFHNWCTPGQTSDAVCFLYGRLTFLGAKHPAPFPSMLVYYGRNSKRFDDLFDAEGAVWRE